jgi:hypothetical protein
MSCTPCTVPTFCNPPDFAVLFPDLVGATGPAGTPGGVIPAFIPAGGVQMVFLSAVTQLTGSGNNSLAAIVTTGFTPPDTLPIVAMIFISGSPQFWMLVASTQGTGLGVQRPNDYDAVTNAKVWFQIS